MVAVGYHGVYTVRQMSVDSSRNLTDDLKMR